MLKPNKFGKYKKGEVVQAGYRILENGLTATEIKNETGIFIPPEKRLEHCVGFVCKQSWRGCVPVFDILEIGYKESIGKL